MQNKHLITQMISTMTATKNKAQPEGNTLKLQKKPLVEQYNKQANKAEDKISYTQTCPKYLKDTG